MGAALALTILIWVGVWVYLSEVGDNQEPLSAEQRLRFVNFLRYAPKGPVTVGSFDADEITTSKLRLIRDLMDNAGYKAASPDKEIRTFPGGSLDTPYNSTFFIVGRDGAQMPPFAGAIQSAFKEIGIDAPFLTNNRPDPTMSPDDVIVFYINRNN